MPGCFDRDEAAHLEDDNARLEKVVADLIPDCERRLPQYDAAAEERAIRDLLAKEAEARAKALPQDKRKGPVEEKEK